MIPTTAAHPRTVPLPGRTDRSQGFVFVTTLLLVLLALLLGGAVFIQLANQWLLVGNVEAQLESLLLAENGVEYARTVLPRLDLNELLVGLDETFAGTGRPEWRNPMPFDLARRLDPATWSPDCDDGLPFEGGHPLLPGGYRSPSGGYFFLRFSNNPEEPPDRDADGIVLLRSMGLVPARFRDPLLPHLQNHVALVEARLRQERAFFLPSPLTLWGDSGTFNWVGQEFSVRGHDGYAVSVISPGGSLPGEVAGSLTPAQEQLLTGLGESPSLQDATALYTTSARYRLLFSPSFWTYFEEQLPRWEDASAGRIVHLPAGGTIETSVRGLVVARGRLHLQEGARIEGLLLHLGDGEVILSGGSSVRGGVWMSNLEVGSGELLGHPLALSVEGSARIEKGERDIQEALALLPPAQLGWRILFPEMTQ